MSPTIKDGDFVYVLYHPFQDFQKDQIVIANINSEMMIKRVIAGPGDEVVFKTGELVVNGKVEEENYLSELTLDEGNLKEKVKLKSDEYLLLGDNRNVSSDSRFFGAVKREHIVGRVFKW